MPLEQENQRARPAACITGMGLVTSLGIGRQDNWAALTRGKSGITAIRRFETAGLATRIGGTIDFDGLDKLPFPLRSERLAETALEEALCQSNLPAKNVPAPLFIAFPPSEMSWSHRLRLALSVGGGGKVTYDEMIRACLQGSYRNNHPTFLPGGAVSHLAERFETRGAPVLVNTACAAGATALQLAVESIRRGDTDIALALASDASIVPDTIVRFSLLAALSMSNDPPERAARPFSLDRDGFVLGEGAAALVVEKHESATARGQRPLGFVLGLGESADRFHLTRSSPDGAAIAAAIRAAIEDSGLQPAQIQYINAHGTGTGENDRVEALALERVFGSYADCPPISSNKSMIGHTMSAAGLIEACFSLLTIENGVLPPTINYRIPDPELPLDVVPNAAKAAKVQNVLSNSFGFGGQNVCLVLSHEPARRN